MKDLNYKIYCMLITIVGLIVIFCLTGCENERTDEYENGFWYSYYIYVDKDTCVEYFVSSSTYNMGNFNPRFNQDGTLKLNDDCINKGDK